MVDERLAGSSVEYLQLNELSDALQRNLQSMHLAKCLFMMRAWHQARPHAYMLNTCLFMSSQSLHALQLHAALPPSCTDACLHAPYMIGATGTRSALPHPRAHDARKKRMNVAHGLCGKLVSCLNVHSVHQAECLFSMCTWRTWHTTHALLHPHACTLHTLPKVRSSE